MNTKLIKSPAVEVRSVSVGKPFVMVSDPEKVLMRIGMHHALSVCGSYKADVNGCVWVVALHGGAMSYIKQHTEVRLLEGTFEYTFRD